MLVDVAKIVERAGSTRVRLTPYQKLVVLDIVESEVDGMVAELSRLGLRADPTPWRRSVMACTGIEFCKLAIVDTKVADIGLKGQLVTDAQGNQVEGFQVHLGGGLGLDSGFGRKLRGHKVTSTELADYVERVLRGFVQQRQPDERFAQWVMRADEGALR
jgi:sulfite reductase (ferredoxin)